MNSVRLNRRTFLEGAAAAGAATILPAPRGASETMQVCCLADVHLGEGTAGRVHRSRFERVLSEVESIRLPDEPVFFGGDLGTGGREALSNAAHSLQAFGSHLWAVPGEVDWHVDRGRTWTELFGPVDRSEMVGAARWVALQTVEFEHGLSARGSQALLEGTPLDSRRVGRFWIGPERLEWLAQELSDCCSAMPIVIWTHVPLLPVYEPWNQAVADAPAVLDLLGRFESVTNVFGHTHRAQTLRRGRVQGIGLPSVAAAMPASPFVEAGAERDWAAPPHAAGRVEERSGWSRLSTDRFAASDPA